MCWLCGIRSQQLFGVEDGAAGVAGASPVLAELTNPAEPELSETTAPKATAGDTGGQPLERSALSASLPIAEARPEC